MKKQLISTQAKHNTLIDTSIEKMHILPNQVAYTFLPDGETEDGCLTYAQLDQKARAIAVLLQEYGAQPGERVLLLYPAGLEYICGFLGCLYARAVAVPCYPPRLNRPDLRLQTIAQDSQARIALTTPEVAASIQQRLANSPALASITWLITQDLDITLAAQWQRPQVTGDTLAFLQYTSGSTSDPKGVMVSHGNLMHNEQIIQKYFEHTSKSCVVTWLPPYHDMGLIGSLLQPLYVGFPAILMTPTAFLQSPIRWLRAISRYKATTSGAPNFAFDFCTQKITDEQKQGLDLSSWDVAFCGAEPIRKETLKRFANAFEPYGFRREALFACYGLAEATLMVSGGVKGKYPSIHRFAGNELAKNRVVLADTQDQNSHELVSCGVPSPDQSILIVDPHTLECCSDNQVGEVWLAGSSVTQGYWNRPIETANTFQAQLAGVQSLFMRTGDLGFLHHGEVYIAGRAKDLVIIRGRNHYPQDIELTVEQSHSALQTGGSAAFSIEVEGEEQLVVVCEVQRTSRTTVDIEEVAYTVRQAVAEQHELQLYGFVLLKPGSLPRTSSGKVQRRACQSAFLDETLDEAGRSILKAIATMAIADEDELDRGKISSASPDMQKSLLEKCLRQQVGKILKVSPKEVNMQQPLVSMGLDSLAVVEFQGYLETCWEVEISFENLLGALTIEKLVNQILDQMPKTLAHSLAQPYRMTVNDGEGLPLSFDQELLWILDQMQPGNPVYNIPMAIRLSGNLDLDTLRESLNDLLKRHESLQTVFLNFRGQPRQKIMDAQTILLPMDDWSTLSQDEQDERLTQTSLKEASIAFDLQQGPLLQTHLIRLAATNHILLFTIHHIVADLWSMSIFVQELMIIYQAKITGTAWTLPMLPLRYTDFALWQRESLQGDMLAGKLAYWRQKLSGAPPLIALPTDYSRPSKQSHVGGSISFTLSSSLCNQLSEISKQEGVTLYTTLLAAFELLLHCYSGQTDIIIGTPIAGRPHRDLEGLVGFFAHPIILRADLSGDPSFQNVVQHIWQVALEAYMHAIPFTKVLEITAPREKSYHPVYQVSFGYFNKWEESLNAEGVRFELADIRKPATDFDLFLTLFNEQGGLRGVMEYSSALFSAETIQQLLDFYCVILESITSNLQMKLSQLALPEALQRKVDNSRSKQQKQTIVLAATFTADPIHDMLAFWLQKIGKKSQIQFAPYGQIFQQLLSPGSLFNQNTHGVNIVLMRFEDWGQFDNETQTHVARLEQNLSELILALKQSASVSSTPCLLCICPASPAIHADQHLANIYQELEQSLADQLADVAGVYVIQSMQIGMLYPVAQYYDAYTDHEGHIPYTAIFFTALATMLTRKIYGLQNPPRKVIVLDCDQTLWKGVCGEDGVNGIELDTPRRLLQEFMVDQQSKGRLLCLCSKNNESDVWDVFERRGEMPLRQEHLTAWRINWKPKSENLKDLARELNLGLDSFIFIDDNPIECAEVKANCPGVEVLLLPAEVERIPKFLAHVWVFDQIKVTQEDRQRTALYHQNTERERLRSDSSSLDDFLANLALQVEISPLQSEQLDRVAQLTQRTNQFNLTTIRRTDREILLLVESGKLQCETVSVRDRFGDYGLVGVLMFAVEENAIQVDTFLLSCRAMGRRIEQFMLARLAEVAQIQGAEYINIDYHPTPKNQPALDFLRSINKNVEAPIQNGFQFCFTTTLITQSINNLKLQPRGA